MTEIEKMRRYIERTKLDKNKMCLVYPEAAALFRQGKDTEDGLFGAPVCEAVFGSMSLCAFANGFPVWLNLMLSILDEIEANIGDIQKQADPRIAKYKAKYEKYAAKFHK